MNFRYFVLFAASYFLFQCNVDTDAADPTSECLELQAKLDTATMIKLDALEAYTKDPSNVNVCENYIASLEDRIEKAKKLVDSGCLSPGAFAGTTLAIEEDQDEINRIDCD